MTVPFSAGNGGAARDRIALTFLPSDIREPRAVGRSVLVGWLTALLPSLGLALLVSALFPETAQPAFEMEGWLAIVLLVLFAPVVETLAMGGVLLVLLRFLSPRAAVLSSAAGWAILHSMQAPAWGLVIWWPFLVFSTLFAAWRVRSLWLAFLVPTLVHALHNLPPALLVATGNAG